MRLDILSPATKSAARVPYLPEASSMDIWPRAFAAAKRGTDLAFAITALPLIGLVAGGLLILNPVFNPGPVFFIQERMGLGGRRFRVWKFRTMRRAPAGIRRFDSPVEADRITALGAGLRRSRIDELPNFLNVLRGEMSLVGPRPDMFEHAETYCRLVPRYAERLRVRPGITGLAQVRGGYADTLEAVRRKARLDLVYVRMASLRVDLAIIRSTVWIMATGFGAK
ncbi:MAG: sugar transferase [Pseudomonadota bacterium]